MESLLQNKNVVMETFVYPLFSKWEAIQTKLVKGKVVVVGDLLSNHQFRDQVCGSYHVMIPIMLALRRPDCKLANIGKVYMSWWTIQESLKKREELPFCIVKPFEAPFNKVKREYVHDFLVGAHSPLHSALFLLDLEYWDIDVNELDEEVLEDFSYVVASFYEDVDDQDAAMSDVTKYKLKEGQFSSTFVQSLVVDQPA